MDYFSLFRVISDYPRRIDIEVINGIKLDVIGLVNRAAAKASQKDGKLQRRTMGYAKTPLNARSIT